MKERIRRGKVGNKYYTGDIVLTVSGQRTTPFPKIDTESNRKTIHTIKRVNEWLFQNAIAEAKAQKDEFNLLQFKNTNLKNLSQSDKDCAEMYLFEREKF